MSRLVATTKLLRGGGLSWLRVARDGLAAVRVAVGAAGLSTGVLECLRDGPADTASVRARLGLDDHGLLEPWLRVLQGHGLVRASAGGWSLSRRGRRLLDDEVVRAAYEGFAGYHTGLYRELPSQLHGGPARRDIAEHGETIAQLTRAMEPVLHEALVAAVREVRPTRILDVGCGAGQNLAAMLAAAPAAEGTGIEVDEAVADIAERLLGERGAAGRARVLRGDVTVLAAGGEAGGPYDLALLANVVYYLPLAERVPLFRALAGLLSEGAPAAMERLRVADMAVRRRVVASLRRRATSAFQGPRSASKRDPFETLSTDSRRLTQLEKSLQALDPTQPGLKQELLLPLALAYARQVLATTPFERIEQYARAIQTVAENLRQEGLAPEAILNECREAMEARLVEHARTLARDVSSPPPAPSAVVNGDAYQFYRNTFSVRAPDGELAALMGLDTQLAFARPQTAASFLSDGVRHAVAQAELAFVHTRIKYLRSWLTQLLTALLPELEASKARGEAERTFERLVRSRFPLLALKEGELVRLRGALGTLGSLQGDLGEHAKKLSQQLRGIDEDFGRFSKRVLELRTSL